MICCLPDRHLCLLQTQYISLPYFTLYFVLYTLLTDHCKTYDLNTVQKIKIIINLFILGLTLTSHSQFNCCGDFRVCQNSIELSWVRSKNMTDPKEFNLQCHEVKVHVPGRSSKQTQVMLHRTTRSHHYSCMNFTS